MLRLILRSRHGMKAARTMPSGALLVLHTEWKPVHRRERITPGLCRQPGSRPVTAGHHESAKITVLIGSPARRRAQSAPESRCRACRYSRAKLGRIIAAPAAVDVVGSVTGAQRFTGCFARAQPVGISGGTGSKQLPTISVSAFCRFPWKSPVVKARSRMQTPPSRYTNTLRSRPVAPSTHEVTTFKAGHTISK